MSAEFGQRCKDIRLEVMEIIRHGRRGHIASAFSMVEILVILYDSILRFDAARPEWDDRDRFILSKGHGCLSLYAILADKGFFPRSAYEGFCAYDGILGGHPTKEKIPGVEASTGSLGHGLSIGAGMALRARMDNKDYRTFVLLGDGECDEGSVWEAAMAASHHKLANLVALVDYNKFQSFASTYDVCDLEPFVDKWQAFGFEARQVNMQENPLELKALLEQVPLNPEKPTAIVCHTIKGQGVSFMERDLVWHHKSKIPDEEIDRIVAELKGE